MSSCSMLVWGSAEISLSKFLSHLSYNMWYFLFFLCYTFTSQLVRKRKMSGWKPASFCYFNQSLKKNSSSVQCQDLHTCICDWRLWATSSQADLTTEGKNLDFLLSPLLNWVVLQIRRVDDGIKLLRTLQSPDNKNQKLKKSTNTTERAIRKSFRQERGILGSK